MGFVSSASSVYLDVHLTNYGRGVVLTGDLKTAISQFSLSDIDIDYRQPVSTGHTVTSQGGLLPDITGNHANCATGVNDGFKCSSLVHQTPTQSTAKGHPQVVVGIDKDLNGNVVYYSDVEIEVYMHDYYALCKLLAQMYSEDHQILYNPYQGTTFTEQQNAFINSFSATSSISSGTFGKALITQALQNLKTKKRGQFVDFWDEVKVNYPGIGKTVENINITSSNQTYMNNAAAITGRLALEGQGCGVNNNYDTEQKYAAINEGLLSSTNIGNSPFTLAFSHSWSGNAPKKGAGPAGIGFTTTEFGYLVLGNSIDWASAQYKYKTYAGIFGNYSVGDYDVNKHFLGFVQPSEFENAQATNYTVNDSTGYGISVVGYGSPASPTYNQTYQRVDVVLPSLKWGITTPPPAPIFDGEDNTNQGLQELGDFGYRGSSDPSTQTTWSNLYYPIKESRATTVKENIDLTLFNFTPGNTTIPEYHQSTYTNNADDTFALLGTNFEYTNMLTPNGVNGTTTPSVEGLWGITGVDVERGKHYYNWYGRMMITGDEFFRSLYQNYNLGNSAFPTYTSQYSARTDASGTAEEIDDFNIKIPMEFKIHSSDSPSVAPATCTVTLVYNKRAAKQSVGYSGFSDFASNDPKVPYWRIFDKTIPEDTDAVHTVAGTYNNIRARFYGEDGENIAAYTTDPTQVTTDGNLTTGKRIFRKVVAGGTVVS